MNDYRAMPDSKERVAERLTLVREALGLNQANLCRKTGFSTSQWAQWETAERRISLEGALTLAKTFGVSLDYIYLGVMSGLPKQMADKIIEKTVAVRATMRRIQASR